MTSDIYEWFGGGLADGWENQLPTQFMSTSNPRKYLKEELASVQRDPKILALREKRAAWEGREMPSRDDESVV